MKQNYLLVLAKIPIEKVYAPKRAKTKIVINLTIFWGLAILG